MSQHSSERASSRGKQDAERHPCLETAIEQRSDKASDQKLLWLFREQLEVQKASLEAILTEHRQFSASEAAEQFERLEGQLSLQRAGLEAAAQRLEVQEQRIEELLARFIQRALVRSEAVQVQSGQPGQELFEGLAFKIRSDSENSLQAHLRSVDELLQNHAARGRATLNRSASSLSRKSPRGPTHQAGEGGLSTIPSDRALQPEGSDATSPWTSHVDVRERSAKDVLAAQAVMGMTYFKRPSSLRKAAQTFGQAEIMVEVVSTLLITMNCLWMGWEADIAMRSLWAGEAEPKWLSTVDFLFALAFLMELIARLAVQGWNFFRCPGVQWNCFDLALLVMQLIDAVTSFYNASFIRTLRILRFFRGARIVKTINAVRQLRVLIACLWGSLSSLLWVMVLLFIVLYLCSAAVMQTLQVSLPHQQEVTDLQDRWGSLWACMSTLFSAVSGGAPWANLLEPLSKISRAYDVGFVLFVIFVVFGMLNIVTALFVESLANLAEVDADTEMRAHVHEKDSAVNVLRKSFLEVASLGGVLSQDQLEASLETEEVVENVKALHMTKEEAVGLFHLLDYDAMGQVSVDEFVFALVKLKSKSSRSVDMATMMYENKRILLRMATFMKVVEDNFRVLREMLGADY